MSKTIIPPFNKEVFKELAIAASKSAKSVIAFSNSYPFDKELNHFVPKPERSIPDENSLNGPTITGFWIDEWKHINAPRSNRLTPSLPDDSSPQGKTTNLLMVDW